MIYLPPIILLSMSMTIMTMNTPLFMNITIMMMSLMSAYMLFVMFKMSWFSYIMMILFLSGLMVVFSYISSLAMNEFLYNFNMSKNTIYLTLIAMTLISFKNENNLFMAENIKFNKFSIYLNSYLMTTNIILISLLFFTLMVVVKISKNKKMPFRSY